MFAWSRLEAWLAVAVGALLVAGTGGHLWLAWEQARRAQASAVEVVAAGSAEPGGMRSEAGETAGIAPQDPQQPGQAGGSDPQVKSESGGDENVSRPASCPPGIVPPAASEAVPQAPAGLIDINRAQAAELERLPGIGPALAKRIVEYRELWGPFDEVDDILEVPGIGPVTLARIRDLIRVE
ncbi:MAG: helix-hairpin-helix domain-containing protein [Firmicutes bacterium]|nr:helix-hairpin-helix domain-containing protein [Bacillota bacterium]